MKVLVTGSSGLIGSELVTFFDRRAQRVAGIDNNMRVDFFGPDGDTRWNLRRLMKTTRHFRHYPLDIRDRPRLLSLFRSEGPFNLIIHCAAQPSHDLAASRPFDDFDVNATGTLNLLETTRQRNPDAVFVFMSTNKVYGDAPNELPLKELERRWDYARPEDFDGISEQMRLDRSKHSIFGASKVAADMMVQEYGRYFGMKTHCLRGGCLTGPHHSGVELHGFLSYLVKVQLLGRTYRIYGYKGKQVRDNIHSYDVARAIEAIYQNPRCGEVYNLGGGRQNSSSILEAFDYVEQLTGKKMNYEYDEKHRAGDHICYISNLAHFRSHYPQWDISKSLDDIFRELIDAWQVRLQTGGDRIVTGKDASFIETLAIREQFRDGYLQRRDPIAEDRMLWRAQMFRHMVHLLPGQTILELGCGQGIFTHQLVRVSRGENPITAVTFALTSPRPAELPVQVEFLTASSLPGPLEGRRFDFIVAMDLLDRRNCALVLHHVYELLNAGGEVLFYESNPWNVVLKLRRALSGLFGWRDPRSLLSRLQLYEMMSQVGFIGVFSVFNDFVYAPLTRQLIWLLRNLSIIAENAPGVRTLAGAILIHAQKPPRLAERPKTSLFAHEQLRQAVSIVIPCHNEEMNIGPLVTRLRDLFDEYIHEIIPVNDNSTDNTAKVIRQLAEEDGRVKPVFRSPPNGVGRAIADGYRLATGRYILSMDCDFQHLLPEVRDLFDAAAQGYDVVVGSRFSQHSVLLNYPFQKIIANRGFHLLARLVLRGRFRDLTNNLKLMRREVSEKLKLMEPSFAINAETGLQPLLMGYTIKEVPISWINRTADMGTSSFRLVRVGGGYWQVLCRLWLRCVFGVGAYKALPLGKGVRQTSRGQDVEILPSAGAKL